MQFLSKRYFWLINLFLFHVKQFTNVKIKNVSRETLYYNEFYYKN